LQRVFVSQAERRDSRAARVEEVFVTFRNIVFVGGPMQYRQMLWDGPDWFQVADAGEALKPVDAAEPKPIKQRRGIYREGERSMAGLVEFNWCGWDDDASVDTHAKRQDRNGLGPQDG
jgi:hypothetical protein